MEFKSIVGVSAANLKLCFCLFMYSAFRRKGGSHTMGKSLAFLSLISLSLFAYGNDYYVKNGSECVFGGDGSLQDCAASNGASGAWRGFGSITWGESANQVGSGDTLHICGGHNEALEIGGSGLPNSEIVITGSCSGSPGTINGGYSAAALHTMGQKYLHVTNLELVGGEVAALEITSNPKYSPVFVRVTNNIMHDPIPSDISGFGSCVKAIGSDILFSTNEIYNCSEDGIYIGGDRVEVAYSYIHDVDISNTRRGDCVKYTSIGLSSDGYVHHNLLDHSSNNIKKNSLIIGSPGFGIVVEYNTIIGGRVTINIRNHSNAIIRYNKIIPKAPETAVWSSGIALENTTGTQIYQNIIDASDAPTFGLLSFGGSSDSVIDNNIFVGNSIKSSIKLLHEVSTYLRSNIIGGERALSVGVRAMLVESDYNWFIYDYPLSIFYGGVAYNSLSDYQLDNPSLDQYSTAGVPVGILDTDGDGAGDDIDVFLLDPAERFDSDGDGTGDNADVSPFNSLEAFDFDGDGVGDNSDNCPTVSNASQMDFDSDGVGNLCDAFPFDPQEILDTDADGIGDIADNCIIHYNVNQLDTDGDNYGNACDADFNNDGIVNSLDIGLFKSMFGTIGDSEADINGDGTVNSLDIGLFKGMFFQAPGPSGLMP